MMDFMNTVLTTVFSLMVATNMVVEVVKKATWNKIPTNVLVVIIAEILTLAVGAAYAQVYNIGIVWYYVVGAIVMGIFVAYAAMFGFDKFKQALEQVIKK